MRIPSMVLLAFAGILTLPAVAKPAFVKKAKDLGLTEVKNCQYCHVEKLPSKTKQGEFNEVGKFLVKKKADAKAAEVDVAWLKDYKK
ncbi:MAG: hypothetical protein IPL96_08510 [Holophagaceae bacterium]|nr:hypothetical protein [Holophagaceae bacterium]